MKFLLCILLAAVSASATVRADELRERQLESDVRRLDREVDDLSRRLDTLERSSVLPRGSSTAPAPRSSSSDSPAWLLRANWDRIKPGMALIEVIALLGRPSSTRSDANGAQTLLYAMEIGPDSVLAGNVRFESNAVREVHRPEMR